MYRISLWLLCCLPLVLMPSPADAIHGGKKCRVTCPRCQTCCQLNVEEVKESKHCWKVECEEICVPRIVFPWQNLHRGCCRTGSCAGASGCTGQCCGRGCCGSAGGKCCKTAHNGARVKTVRKLKKHSYECPACEYEWTPKKVCRRGCYGNCSCSSAALGTDYDEHGELEEAPAEPQPSVPKPGEPLDTEPRTPVSREIREFQPPERRVEVQKSVDSFDCPNSFNGFGKRSVRFAPESAGRELASRY